MPIDGIGRLSAISQKATASNSQQSNSANEIASRKRQEISPANEKAAQATQRRAAMELELRLRVFRQTLSPAAASLLDQWVQWASDRR